MATTISRLDTRELRAWRGLLHVYAQLSKALDAQLVAEHGLPLTSYEVLMYLSDADGGRMRMNELADKAVLSRSNLTRLVDRLEQAGLVERQRSEDDRRGAFAVLTAEGKAMRKRMWPVYQAAIRALFEDQISEAEAATMGKALRRVLDAARSRPAEDLEPANKR